MYTDILVEVIFALLILFYLEDGKASSLQWFWHQFFSEILKSIFSWNEIFDLNEADEYFQIWSQWK